MDLKEEILAYLKEHKQRYLESFSITEIALFGSMSNNTESDQSDIDLLIEFKDHTSDLSKKKNLLKAELSERFKRSVDLCRIKYIKSYFRKNILDQAIYV